MKSGLLPEQVRSIQTEPMSRRVLLQGGAGGLLLSFSTAYGNPPSGPFTLRFRDGLEVRADLVISALPFSTLRKVDLSGLQFSPEKRDAIQQLDYGQNTKLSGSFESRLWRTRYASSGSVHSDRAPYQGWDSTIGERRGDALSIWAQFTGCQAATEDLSRSPQAQLSESLAGLEPLWPGINAAWRGDALRSAWSAFEWAQGSYSCFRPGQWKFAELIGRRGGRVLFCGEHCSVEFQGWMEGGAETGLRAAENAKALIQAKERKP